MAESFALLHMAQRKFDGETAEADGARGIVDAAEGDAEQGGAETLVEFADQLRALDADVVQHQGPFIAAGVTEQLPPRFRLQSRARRSAPERPKCRLDARRPHRHR